MIKVKKTDSKRNFLVKIIGLGLLAVLPQTVFAEQRDHNQEQSSYRDGQHIPVDSYPNKQVVRDRVELNTGANAHQYKEIQYKQMERDRVLNEIFDPLILMTPVERTIRPIDVIGISPAYITQIVFPAEFIVTDHVASFATSLFEAEKNIVRIRPDINTFFAGNMVLTLSDGRKNYTMSIFAERYYSNECKEDASEKSYICRKKREVGLQNTSKYTYAYNNLSTLYRYTNPVPIDDMAVIALYERMNGRLLHIRENGEAVSLSYEGINYTITRDDRFGSFEGGIMYRGVGYRVTTSSSVSGE